MSITMTSSYRSFELPWSQSAEQERRFRRITLWVLGFTAIFALIVPWLPVPQAERPQFVEVPVEMLPPPPPPPEVKKPEPEPPKPVQKRVEPKPVPPTTKPVPPKPVPPQPTARERAEQAMNSLADDFAALRDTTTADQVANANATINAAPGAATRTERNMITSQVGKASGGIGAQSVTKGTGGGVLAGRGTTQIKDPGAGIASAAGKAGASSGGSRSHEEIELVFDQNKGALYALYSRALRQTPGLQGKLVLSLTIQPNGVVSACSVVSSELGDPELEGKIVQRVKAFRFQAKDVAPVTSTKPVDFFPAS